MINLAPGDKLGKYTTTKFIGAGVFGAVYLMHDNLMNRDVAVKFVENQNPAAFVAHFEAQILHQCRNARTVAVNSVDVFQDTTGRYYAAIEMEYLDGGSAQTLIDARHVSIRQSMKILIDILFALDHSHRQNILHRDAKPANFMLAGNIAKLTDFGLATTAAASLTASGAGSPVYCAPEVINDNITNVQTDIFAAGMSLFQLANNISNLGARVPSVDVVKMGRVISSVGYQQYVPRRLRNVCNKACSFEPARRYTSAAAMRQALEKLHVRQDWQRPEPDKWHAQITNQQHDMSIENGNEMVYRINGRRRNSNCVETASVDEAVSAQERWVYNNTF